jgi:hypothetical protein
MKRTLLLLSLVGFIATAELASPVAQAKDITGSWEMTTYSPEGTRVNTMVIRKDGDKLKAIAKGPNGERDYDSVEVQGSQVTIVLTIDYQGTPMIITYSGVIDKDGMHGNADFGGLAQGTWAAVPTN